MNERPKFEKLEVWQLAKQMAVEVYRLTQSFPKEERFGLVDQVRRAAISIAANIAEGEGRYQTNDQIHFLHIARGSLDETRCLLTIARDLGFLSPAQETTMNDKASLLHAKLHAFIASKHRLQEHNKNTAPRAVPPSNLEPRTSSVAPPVPRQTSMVERRTSRHQRDSAFTLIELLVVIGIMGLMIGLAVPAFNSATRGNAVTAGASQIVNTLMLARAKAITSRTHVRIIFADTTTNTTANTSTSPMYGKTACAVLMCTNMVALQAGESASTAPCWIYLDRWQQLPKGSFIPSYLLSGLLTTQFVPFPTNSAAASATVLPYIEFKSTGALTSSTDLYVATQEGTLLPGGTIGNIRAANTLSNQIFSITGVAKVLR